MNRQRGYSWPSSEVTYVERIDDSPETTATCQIALCKLLDWGDHDIAVILGLLPDDEEAIDGEIVEDADPAGDPPMDPAEAS